MEQTSNVVSDASTTSPRTDTSSTSNSDPLAGTSFKEAALKYADQKESERALNPEGNDEDVANVSEEASEPSSDRKEQTKKDDVSPGVKRRIDGLTAKYKAEQASHRETSMEVAKLREAVRLYASEMDRISAKANLDPREEQIRELQLQREIDQIEQRIPGEVDERFSSASNQMALQERASEIADTLRAETASWDGLFTARELAMSMKSTRNLDPVSAARALGESRLSAAQKRMKSPSAPRTAGSNSSGSREAAQPWRYAGTSSIKDFMDSQERTRRGR